MLAAILNKQNEDLIIDEIENLPLEAGQVLVQVESSSVCGRQIGEFTGAKGPDRFLPHLLGHEGCGIVEDVGAGVKTVKKGDKVVMHWRKGSGIESSFPMFKFRDRLIGGGLVTTLSEKSVVSENRVTKVDSSVPSDVAALLGCAATTGLGIISREAQVTMGEGVMVFGSGGVGLSVIQGAKLASAFPIIAVDVSKQKLDKAKELGATHCYNNSSELESDIPSAPHVIVETTGRAEVIEQAYKIVASGGRIILVGQPHIEQALILNSFASHFKGITVKDSEGGLTNPSVDIPRYINLYQNGLLKLDSLITNRYALQDINQVFSDMRNGAILGKSIIDCNNG